ncbi:MAG: haloacid dehalogenase-like hydrolase [Prevotella sp.]|nr:haloacid dehalogenase-like hydrolase [Prevotella sp.]
METNRQHLFLFDFDGTLTTRDTLLEFIRYACGTWMFLCGFLLYSPLLVLMKLHLYPNWKAKQRVFSFYFKGMSLSRFDELCQGFAEEKRSLLRPDMLEKLQQALQAGQRVLVVSASIDNWVRPFFDHQVTVLGTQIETTEGRLTGRFLTNNCYGAEKVNRVQTELALEEGTFNREDYDITAYGDSRGDREMLAFADEGHLVSRPSSLVSRISKLCTLFSIRREERWMAWVALAFFIMLNVLTICRYYDVFTPLQSDYWNLFVKWFSISGFDPITYYVVSDWEARYNVYRHPLLAFMMYLPYLLNRGLMWLTGINCVQFVVALMLVVAALYAFIFMYRILREVIELERSDATWLSAMLFSFAFVMVSSMVPDHFILSMFILLFTLYVSGKLIKERRSLGVGKTVLLFVLTAGISLNNGLKTFLAGLFVNGRSFFRPQYLLGAVLLPGLLMWGFCRWEYTNFVLPHEQARHAAKRAQKAKKAQEEKEKMAKLQVKEGGAGVSGVSGVSGVQEVKKKVKKRDPRLGKPMGEGEFMRWTDISTPRWDSVVENLFGESLQLHSDHLLKDEFRSRPIIVQYRWSFNYIVEALLVLLFVVGLWCGRHSRFLWLVVSWFVLDMLLHVGLGFGLNEVYIMTAHWVFIMPLAMAYLFKNLKDRYTLRMVRRVAQLLVLYLYIYNVVLIFQFMT